MLPGGVWNICCLSFLPPPPPRHWPHFTGGSPHHIAHTGGHLAATWRTGVWMTPTDCRHLAAVPGIKQSDPHGLWLCGGSLLRRSVPSRGGGGFPLQGSDRAEVSCRSLCKRRHPGPQTWFADLSTVVPAPTFSSPQTLQRPELARHHESRKKVSLPLSIANPV